MICARPGCGEAESRVNGYCSVYCEDTHELDIEVVQLREALLSLLNYPRSVSIGSIASHVELSRVSRERYKELLAMTSGPKVDE